VRIRLYDEKEAGGRMDTVKVTYKSSEKASRLELFIRIVWTLLCGIVLIVTGIFAAIAIIIQFIYILIFGKRHMGLNTFVGNWLVAFNNLMFYKNLVTDERPELFPKF
jgi:hypothetical protein